MFYNNSLLYDNVVIFDTYDVLDVSRVTVLEFFIDIKSFHSHYGPRVGSASNRNEYQEHFQGVKAAGV